MLAGERAAIADGLRLGVAGGLVLHGRGVDLSSSGVGFVSAARLEPSEAVRVRWCDELIEVDGRVVWCEGQRGQWRGGVEFQSVPSPYDEVIRRMIADAELDRQRRVVFPGAMYVLDPAAVWQRVRCYDLGVAGAGFWTRHALRGRVRVALSVENEEPLTTEAAIVWTREDAQGWRGGLRWLEPHKNGPRVARWLQLANRAS